MQDSWDEECGRSPEKNCTAPRLKRVKTLQQLTAELKEPGASAQAEQSHSQPPETRKSGSEKATSAQEGASAGEAAKKIQEEASDVDRETAVVTRRADRFDASELFLEISIVLCSISLLAENKIYWRLSFITSAIGIAIAVYGYVLR
jgi:hypothetical protein